MSMLNIGDPVQVVANYFVAYLRGARGTVSPVYEHIRNFISEEQIWIEFDELVPDEEGKLTDAGAFLPTDLQPLQ